MSDTKPTIETVLERLQDFRSSLDSRLTNFEQRLERIEKEQVITNHKLDRVILETANLRAHIEVMETRIDRIDVNPTAPTQRIT